jgi:uncharacterized protein YbjQ (UPF0145 family)
MSGPASDLPEAAQRRLTSGAFSSGLSVSDFAACLEMGLEPVGLVQGFCAMQVANYAMGSYTMGGFGQGVTPYGGAEGGYVQNYQCPHGVISAEHRMWGQNYQQTWVESAWRDGFNSAFVRMMEEAQAIAAHGVIGVVDSVQPLSDTGVVEYHLTGTAVTLRDGPAPTSNVWSTYLAGQRLAKIFEAGYAPVSIVASVSSIRVWASCITAYLMEGTNFGWSNNAEPTEVDQIVSAQTNARDIVRAKARSQLHGDALHGASMDVATREFSRGDLQIEIRLRGNRIRRFKDFDPLAVPKPTVRLS